MFERKRLTLLGINSVFMATAVLLVTLGYYLQLRNIYMGLIITELVIMLIPAFIYVKWKGAKIKEAFALKSISLATLWKCVLITLCAYPVGLFLNLLGNMVLGLFGELIPLPVPVASNAKEYIVNLLVIALTAGVAEEVFFRGFILKGYQRLGERKAILISAFLFGVFHFNIQNFIGPVFLGLVFGYLAVRTGSVIAPIVGHFINNAVSVTLMFVAGMVSGTATQGPQNAMDSEILLAGLVFWGIFALLGGFAAVRMFTRLERTSQVSGDIFPAPKFLDFIPIMLTVIIFIIFSILEFLVIIYNTAG